MLQLTVLRCCNATTVVALQLAVLWRCWCRGIAATALLVLWRCGAVATALCWCRGVAAEFFFFSTVSGEKKRERGGETLKPVQRSPLWQECNTQALSNT